MPVARILFLALILVSPAAAERDFARVEPTFAPGVDGVPRSLDFSPDGRAVAVVDESQSGFVVNRASGRTVLNLGDDVLEAAFSVNSDQVLIVNTSGKLKRLTVPGSQSTQATPIKRQRFIGCRSGLQNNHGQMLLWEVESAKSYAQFSPSKVKTGMTAVSPDGRRWAIVGRRRGSKLGVELADLPKGQVNATAELEGRSCFGVAFSRDGKQVLIPQREGVLVLTSDWGKHVKRLTDPSLKLESKKEKRRGGAASTNILPSVEQNIDGGNWGPRKPSSYKSVAAGPDGIVYCGGGDGVLRIWDVTTSQLLARLGAEELGRPLQAIDRIATDATGKRIVLAAGRDLVFLDFTKVSGSSEPSVDNAE